MLLGIDVGGTFTDAVVVNAGNVLVQSKQATTHANILDGILSALDAVLDNIDVKELERVVISSTIVTNTLTEGKTDSVFLAVMAGPGMNVSNCFPVKPHFVGGYVDHRGKIIAHTDWRKDSKLLDKITGSMAAVSGKFAVRNPENEHTLAAELKHSGCKKVFLGSELSGELNFVRRTNSAYFAAAVYKTFVDFVTQIKNSLQQRNITAPVQILKADGGTLPLEIALKQPVETVFTGPAASVLGIEALGAPECRSISLDVGGTTTDIAFWEQGQPLLAKQGARIDGYPTAVRSFHMRSVGVGGDSCIKLIDNKFQVGPERAGKAMALGGEEATLSDALIVLGYADFGDHQMARQAMELIGVQAMTVEDTARAVVDAAVRQLKNVIEEMLHEWGIQPVYTVNDVIKGTEFIPEELIGVGGGAPGLVRALSEKMQIPYVIPKGAMVANAIGAALAKPTLAGSLRADTTEGYYLIPESGKKNKLPSGFGMDKAESLLKEWLQQQAKEWHVPMQETEIISKEFFRTIHGYYDSGEIIYLRMQLKPGILYHVTGREVVF